MKSVPHPSSTPGFVWPPPPTPLIVAPALARRCGVAAVFIKDESQRYLGNFKSLGGTRAALSALARAAEGSVLDAARPGKSGQARRLLCASAGNHGLAVAAAGQIAGVPVKVFVADHVSPVRKSRIASMGATLVTVRGNYDDAVCAARRAEAEGEGILIADTSSDPNDPIVRDVIDGYRLVCAEAAAQRGADSLSHIVVQAGVGGLAAAVAQECAGRARLILVEPKSAASVAAAMEAGTPVKIGGSLRTEAAMLACGEASAPALAVLKRYGATAISLTDEQLHDAKDALRQATGIQTTASGAAGLAGLIAARRGTRAAAFAGITGTSRVLVIVTEGPFGEE